MAIQATQAETRRSRTRAASAEHFRAPARETRRRKRPSRLYFALVATVFGGAATADTSPGSGQCVEQKLFASDAAPGDQFGYSVAIDGDLLVAGAPGIRQPGEPPATAPGSAYVFQLQGAAWVEVAKLTASDPQPGAQFGVSVSISGEVVAVGTDLAEAGGVSSGAVYVFRCTGGIALRKLSSRRATLARGIPSERPFRLMATTF